MAGHGAVLDALAWKRTEASPHVVELCHGVARTVLTFTVSQQSPILACAHPMLATTTSAIHQHARNAPMEVWEGGCGGTCGGTCEGNLWEGGCRDKSIFDSTRYTRLNVSCSGYPNILNQLKRSPPASEENYRD